MSDSIEELWSHQEAFAEIKKSVREAGRIFPGYRDLSRDFVRNFRPCRALSTDEIEPLENYSENDYIFNLVLYRGEEASMIPPKCRNGDCNSLPIRNTFYFSYEGAWNRWALGCAIISRIRFITEVSKFKKNKRQTKSEIEIPYCTHVMEQQEFFDALTGDNWTSKIKLLISCMKPSVRSNVRHRPRKYMGYNKDILSTLCDTALSEQELNWRKYVASVHLRRAACDDDAQWRNDTRYDLTR